MEQFSCLVGEILMYCQCIEHDVKRIYAFMSGGDEEDNLYLMEKEKWTLGQTVTELKTYDESAGGTPLFTKEDYDILFQIVRYRNYYAHQVYLGFVYEDEEEKFERSFNKAADKAVADKKLLSSLYGRVEDARIRYTEE